MSEEYWDDLNVLFVIDNTRIDTVSKLLKIIDIENKIDNNPRGIIILEKNYTSIIEFSDLPDNIWGFTSHKENKKTAYLSHLHSIIRNGS
jgi:hypothetical protein